MAKDGIKKLKPVRAGSRACAGSLPSKLSKLQKTILTTLYLHIRDLNEGITLRVLRTWMWSKEARAARHNSINRLVARRLVCRVGYRHVTLTPKGFWVAKRLAAGKSIWPEWVIQAHPSLFIIRKMVE